MIENPLAEAFAADQRRAIRTLKLAVEMLEGRRRLGRRECERLAILLRCEMKKLDDTLHVHGYSAEQWLAGLPLT